MARARLQCVCGGWLYIIPGSASRLEGGIVYRKRKCVKCHKAYETKEEMHRSIPTSDQSS